MEMCQRLQLVKSPMAMPKRKAPSSQSPTINVTNDMGKEDLEMLSDAIAWRWPLRPTKNKVAKEDQKL
jgi:hypothetical protein